MKRSILFMISMLCLLFTASLVCYATPPREDYVLVLADEFDGDTDNAVRFTLGTTVLSVLTIPALSWLLQLFI